MIKTLDWKEKQKILNGIKEYIENFVTGEVLIEEDISFTSIYSVIIIYIKNNTNKIKYNFMYRIEEIPLQEISKNDINEILNIYKQKILHEFFW